MDRSKEVTYIWHFNVIATLYYTYWNWDDASHEKCTFWILLTNFKKSEHFQWVHCAFCTILFKLIFWLMHFEVLEKMGVYCSPKSVCLFCIRMKSVNAGSYVLQSTEFQVNWRFECRHAAMKQLPLNNLELFRYFSLNTGKKAFNAFSSDDIKPKVHNEHQ